jgi:hypothetical protein
MESLGQFSSSVAVVAWDVLIMETPLSDLEEASLIVLTGAILKEAVG